MSGPSTRPTSPLIFISTAATVGVTPREPSMGIMMGAMTELPPTIVPSSPQTESELAIRPSLPLVLVFTPIPRTIQRTRVWVTRISVINVPSPAPSMAITPMSTVETPNSFGIRPPWRPPPSPVISMPSTIPTNAADIMCLPRRTMTIMTNIGISAISDGGSTSAQVPSFIRLSLRYLYGEEFVFGQRMVAYFWQGILLQGSKAPGWRRKRFHLPADATGLRRIWQVGQTWSMHIALPWCVL